MVKAFLFITILFHFVFLTQTRFTLWPEMVVYPYLFNQGFELYTEIINPYTPLLIWGLGSFSQIFGYSPMPFQILTWLIILSIDLLIFRISKNLFKNSSKALLSTAFFAILSIPFYVNGLWFDLVQTPLVLLAFYNFYKYYAKPSEIKALVISSIFLAIAIFIKQQAAWLVIWFGVIILVKERKHSEKLKKISVLILTPAIFLIAFLLLFYLQNNLDGFASWSLLFPIFQAPKMPGYVLLPDHQQLLMLLFLFFIFIPTLFSKIRLITLTALLLTVFAYPRFDYFHLIPSLAILSLSFGELVAIRKSRANIFLLIGLIFLSAATLRYLKSNWTQEVRFFEKNITDTAIILSQKTKQQEKIYIQNGPDQLLPLSGRIPTKPWADEFPWYLELEGQQEKISASLEKEKPEYVVSKPYDTGSIYQLGAYKPSLIKMYIDANYEFKEKISTDLMLLKRK
ncbi:MAG: glycosyltransferase family 39 protein [Candidatus Curtissbacteria bacterium]|nr:glycosyltransferase family 39 protein [Candidatus Curtissbacteria bacterium]